MEETIAAVATALGEGGIGIIRISGERAKDIYNKIFVPKYLQCETQIVDRRLVYGNIVDSANSETLDEVLCVYMKSPHTYTTEDVVEIHCHGSIVALRKILSLVLRNGARLAEKGEFTKRAFLNGRLDLSQAEAVMDLVQAKTDKGFSAALSQLDGALSGRIKNLRAEMTELLSLVIVNLDYPDEDIEMVTYETLKNSLMLLDNQIVKLIATADTGRMIREGIAVSIIGKPNVGKSSLMNALLQESRAIVTDIPGTTRDTIEETLSLSGIPVKLTDTAGIRETADKIEQIGIEKSKQALNKADLILFLIDGASELEAEDMEIISVLEAAPVIVLLNKRDLGQVVTEADIMRLLPSAQVIASSMTESIGISELEGKILDLVYGGTVRQENSMLVTNVRHRELLEQADQEIREALRMTDAGEALDFIEISIRTAWDLLGEMIGEAVTENIIDEVFSRFCLGK